MELPKDLRDALATVSTGLPVEDVAQAAARLIGRYRSAAEVDEPILNSAADVAAYAAYRMPATYAAVRAALAQVTLAAPRFAPRTHVDAGGGTGSAAWAAAHAYPSIASIAVIEQVSDALALGRRIAEGSQNVALRMTDWRQARLDTTELPRADLVTISYVLGELGEAQRDDLVRRCAASAGVVVIVEPGTPAGYERVIAARSALIDSGLTVVAPCPHQSACPILPGRDWCHFAARISRTTLHRRLKEAELGYEDEKFSYVAAARGAGAVGAGRVLRHPRHRKGLVTLRVCTPEDGITATLISKRQSGLYRAARDVSWGDAWPPPGEGVGG